MWKIINSIITNKTREVTDDFVQIIQNEKILNSQIEIAEAFNTFFINIGQSITDDIVKPPYYQSQITPTSSKTCVFTNLDNTTPKEVTSIINKLNSNCSSGYDGLSTKFLKQNINFFAVYLCTKINECLKTGCFPNSLKIAKVKAIFKSGCKLNLTNYRPISVLSVISKVFEIVIKYRLEDYIEKNHIIHPNQYGFIKSSSTISACTSLVHTICDHKNNRKKTAALFIDFKKAFDCISYDKLQNILFDYGIRETALKLILSYLQNRKQFVVVGGESSILQKIVCGVPQGSILGPLLFNIYINIIFSIKLKGHLQLYADDAVLTYGEIDYPTLKSSIQSDLYELQNYLIEYNLVMNLQKTKIMIFKRNYLSKYDTGDSILDSIEINGELISTVTTYKYLGLVIDSTLSWKPHIKELAAKISPFIGLIYRMKKYVSTQILFNIYYAFVDSRLTYCLPIWGRSAKKHTTILQTMQNRAIKIITNKPKLTPTNILFNENFLSFHQKISYESILLIWKIQNKYLQCNVTLPNNYAITQTVTRQKYQIRVPNFRTTTSQSSLLYCGVQLFNDLPEQIRNTKNIFNFKKLLKTYIYKNISIK